MREMELWRDKVRGPVLNVLSPSCFLISPKIQLHIRDRIQTSVRPFNCFRLNSYPSDVLCTVLPS